MIQNESWSGKFLITLISWWIFWDCRSLFAYQLCIFGKVSYFSNIVLVLVGWSECQNMNIPSSPIFLVKMNVNQALCQSFTNQYILFVVGHHRWYGLCYVGVMRWSCQKLAAAEYFFPSSWYNYFMILGSCLLGIACRQQKDDNWTGLLKKEPSERLPMRPGGLQNVPWTTCICLDGLMKWM